MILGIDPGKSGGIVGLDREGGVLFAITMPQTETDIWRVIGSVPRPTRACIEAVHSMPGNKASSMFTFGMGYGGLRMALLAAKIPFEAVPPQTWQGAMRCRSKGDKNLLKARAQELFPMVTVTLRNADSLLIAEYYRRKLLGIL